MCEARCCWITNINGPAAGPRTFAPGSGVEPKVRFDVYSRSLSSAMPGILGRLLASGSYGGPDSKAAPRGRERLLVQGMEGQLLPGEDQAGGNAALLFRAPAHRRDQQYVLPHA